MDGNARSYGQAMENMIKEEMGSAILDLAVTENDNGEPVLTGFCERYTSKREAQEIVKHEFGFVHLDNQIEVSLDDWSTSKSVQTEDGCELGFAGRKTYAAPVVDIHPSLLTT